MPRLCECAPITDGAALSHSDGESNTTGDVAKSRNVRVRPFFRAVVSRHKHSLRAPVLLFSPSQHPCPLRSGGDGVIPVLLPPYVPRPHMQKHSGVQVHVIHFMFRNNGREPGLQLLLVWHKVRILHHEGRAQTPQNLSTGGTWC